MKLLWLTDLHLDKVGEERRQLFYDKLRGEDFDAVVITGDISCAARLCADLLQLGSACNPRPLYFVLGNHDFHGSSFAKVDKIVVKACLQQKNLRHLGQGEIIPLTDTTAMIGHRGWYDGRAGMGISSKRYNPDSDCIEDLQCSSQNALFSKLAELGKASGKYFREVLPYALQCYEHVLVATHVPPVAQAALYSGKPCGPRHLPYYTNISAGGGLQRIAGNFQKKRVTVLCGHTHSRAAVRVGREFWVYAGAAHPGRPEIQWVFEL